MTRSDKVQLLLDRAQKSAEGKDYKPASPIVSLPWNESVRRSPDLERILRIPRRVWTEEELEGLSDLLTPLLKKPNGTQRLRPAQALALHDLGAYKGLISTVRVGGGKTLIALLAAYMVKAVRPLILVPANLKEKTLRDIRAYRKHWEIAEFVRVESYELLSRKHYAGFFESYRPDLVVGDEAHHLKNTSAAIVKRLKRYLRDIRPQTMLALMSGTLSNRSLLEVWHLFRWTFPQELCPLPHDFEEMSMWAAAVDEKVGVMNRVQPGALLEFCTEEEKLLAKHDPLKAARFGVRRRLTETPGVVTTKETFEGSSLQINPYAFEPPPIVQKAIQHLREEWETPDGWPISDGATQVQHAKELALGFYYRWNPRPPAAWLEKRKEWCQACRKILSHNQRNLDTEAQVMDAIDSGEYKGSRDVLKAWREVEPSYKIQTEPVWVDDFAIDKAIEWSKKNVGIIWALQRAFGLRLAEKSGLPYYCAKGFTTDGKYIEDHPADECMIASITANREGKNLQKWNKNLITSPPSSGAWWEQVIARTHRDGQEADTVFVDMFYVVLEHLVAFYRAVGDAKYMEEDWGQIQKLLYADVTLPQISDLGDEEVWEAKPSVQDVEEKEETEEQEEEDDIEEIPNTSIH